MSSAFASPPEDPEYNKLIESHPDFARASQLANWLNIAGPCVFALPILNYFIPSINEFAPWFFPLLIGISIAILPASILLVIWFKGLVWYNMRLSVPHPSSILGVFAGGIALTAMGMMNGFVAYGPIFLRALYPAIIFWLAMLFTTNEFKQRTSLDIGNMCALLFISYVFSVGAYATSNCAFDGSEPKVYTSVITQKEITKDKDHEKSFWLHFQPVADISNTQTEVHEDLYNAVEVDDPIEVNVKEGLWGTAWYYLKVHDGF